MYEKGWHYGRSWSSHRLEDECPCEQAPCGLVVDGSIHPDCTQHNLHNAKTIRQSHSADQCPGAPS